MRKITVLSFITLDGVMQAPGGPEEDPTEDFKYGGWSAPFDDEASGPTMQKQMARADLLLGRKTFDIFESYWPKHAENWPGVNEVTKYVLSTTRNSSDWQNCEFLSGLEDIRKLRNSEGPDIKIWGSSKLVHLLLKNDLVDEFWLNIHPIILGKGKRLFTDEAVPRSFTLVESFITPGGVILANYKRGGDIKTGTMGA
jgi:dihydrofolate reductase